MNKGGYHPKPTIEKIKEILNKKDIDLLESEYINAKTKMKYHCRICDNYDSISWQIIQRGCGCSICAIQKIKDKQKLDIEFVKSEFIKYGFTLLDFNYKNTGTPLSCICKCGELTETTLDAVRRGSGCMKCGIESRSKKSKLSYDFVKDYFLQYRYILLEDTYVNWETKMKYRCDKGHINYMHWNAFKNGSRCPDCSPQYKKKTIEFVRNEFEKYGYKLLDDVYINNETPLNYKCPKGHMGKITWANFQFGQRCGKCDESKGERKIYDYLKVNNIIFIREYKFKGCKNKKSLPFDFAIFNDNNLYCLIEYDGEFHYKSIEIFGGEDRLEYLQQNDQIKNKYCQDNNIKLIRIPYWDFDNIEEILDKELHNFTKKEQQNIENIN